MPVRTEARMPNHPFGLSPSKPTQAHHPLGLSLSKPTRAPHAGNSRPSGIENSVSRPLRHQDDTRQIALAQRQRQT